MIEKIAGEIETIAKNERNNEFDPDKRIEINNLEFNTDKNSFNPDKRIELKPDNEGYYSQLEERVKNSNLDTKEGGLRSNWEGKRGESLCKPTYEFMKNELAKYGKDGVEFSNGVPDFSPFARETVVIDKMTEKRQGPGNNFDQASTKLAEMWNDAKREQRCNWTARDVEDYKRANNLTWHERCDLKTMDLVPTKIHEYFKHWGGCAEYKAKIGIGGKFDG